MTKGRESGRDGGESDERGKAKKCVLKRDKDKATAVSVDKTKAADREKVIEAGIV